MPSLVPIVRCREIPTNSKLENRSIARLELVYRSTLTYVAARIHSFNERSRAEESHHERFSVRSTFATNRYTQGCTCTFYAYSVYRTHRSTEVSESKQFRQVGRQKKKYQLRIPFFFLFFLPRLSFFFSFSFRKIVSTLALDVQTRRKYRCEYAGDRGTILINQINEKTIILI